MIKNIVVKVKIRMTNILRNNYEELKQWVILKTFKPFKVRKIIEKEDISKDMSKTELLQFRMKVSLYKEHKS